MKIDLNESLERLYFTEDANEITLLADKYFQKYIDDYKEQHPESSVMFNADTINKGKDRWPLDINYMGNPISGSYNDIVNHAELIDEIINKYDIALKDKSNSDGLYIQIDQSWGVSVHPLLKRGNIMPGHDGVTLEMGATSISDSDIDELVKDYYYLSSDAGIKELGFFNSFHDN